MTTPSDPRGKHLPDDSMSPEEESDALVSAYLDGEATAAERARVEADPALLARLEQFRSVRSALTDDVSAPAGALDDLVAGAVAASSEVQDSPDVSPLSEGAGSRRVSAEADALAADDGGRTGAVADLAEARARRRATGWIGGVVAVAAALVLFIVAVPAMLSGDDGPAEMASFSEAADEIADADGAEESFADIGATLDMEGFDAPMEERARDGSFLLSAEGPLVLLPLPEESTGAATPDVAAPATQFAGDDAGLGPAQIGRFPDRPAAQQGVTAAVLAAIERPPPTGVDGWFGAPDGPVAACLGQPPLGAEHTGLHDPDALVFVGAFEQAGDERYVVVLDLDADTARTTDARYRVLEVQAGTCVLLGEQLL